MLLSTNTGHSAGCTDLDAIHPAPPFLTKHLPGAVTAGPASVDVCVAIQCVLLHGRAPGDACAWHLEGLYSTNIAFQSRAVVVLQAKFHSVHAAMVCQPLLKSVSKHPAQASATQRGRHQKH